MCARSHSHQQRGVVKFPNQPITMMRRVVPSVRAGAQECGEKAWHIPVSIHGMVVDAVVDTAAEITIISQRVYISLKPRPGGCKEMNVRLAGGGASMVAGFFSEVEIGIGEYQCHHPVYVAALQDSMLQVKCYHLERDCLLLDDSGVIWRQTGDKSDLFIVKLIQCEG